LLGAVAALIECTIRTRALPLHTSVSARDATRTISRSGRDATRTIYTSRADISLAAKNPSTKYLQDLNADSSSEIDLVDNDRTVDVDVGDDYADSVLNPSVGNRTDVGDDGDDDYADSVLTPAVGNRTDDAYVVDTNEETEPIFDTAVDAEDVDDSLRREPNATASDSRSAKKKRGINLFQNIFGRSAREKAREESARARLWKEWLSTGKKSRQTMAEGSELIPELAGELDEGDDYVVVAVPASAADGFGQVLPSFPGGKLFQKSIAGTSLGSGRNRTKVEKTPDKPRETKKKDKLKVRREPGFISANDWKHNIWNIPTSSILRNVLNPVKDVFVWATVLSILHKMLQKYSFSDSAATIGRGVFKVKGTTAADWFVRHMQLPAIQHTIMVSAMSLLLVFRTNSAYQRFAEGRKIWNDIVDTTRDFSRMLKLYEFAIGREKCRRLNNLLASFPYLLRHRIRPSSTSFSPVNDDTVERDVFNSLLLYQDECLRDTDSQVGSLTYDEEETGASRRAQRELYWVDKRTLPWSLLPGSALELCSRAQNRPLWVCDRMAAELSVVDDDLPKFTNRERLALIGYAEKLSRSIGACERIHQTVVPLSYARHALRSVTAWLWTLPFALIKDVGLYTGPVVAVLAWCLFGIYEIGTRIEDPFQGTLRLSVYCDAIRRDVLADSIARDTAFILDESKRSDDEEGVYDAILESDSESDEYANGSSAAAAPKQNDQIEFIRNLSKMSF